MNGLETPPASVEQRAVVADVQRLRKGDGPGVRTVVLLKGCPLRCGWCHNPEACRPVPEPVYAAERCIHCGSCIAACPFGQGRLRLEAGGNPDLCIACLRCALVCPSGAIEACGRGMTAAEVLAEVLEDRAVFEASGGGLTLSGGEPLARPRFARALLAGAKEAGIHTCVETCGYVPLRHIAGIAPHTDLLLWHIKHTSRERHKEVTGVHPDHVWENLRQADAWGVANVLRCVIFAGENDTIAHMQAVAALYHALRHCRGVELIAYQPVDPARRALLGHDEAAVVFRAPDAETLDRLRARLGREQVPIV